MSATLDSRTPLSIPIGRDSAVRAGPPSTERRAASFPRLRLPQGASDLLDLPWEQPLEDWDTTEPGWLDLPVGPSRHLVRFLASEATTYALKAEPLHVARREFAVLRHLAELGLPAVAAVGLAEAPERDEAILVTEYLPHSVQYRRLLMRFPAGPNANRDRLMDAMANLLVDLHGAGVYWGDCSLANTLFRRDGDRVQAFLSMPRRARSTAPSPMVSARPTSRCSSRTLPSDWRTSRPSRSDPLMLTTPLLRPRMLRPAMTPSERS